jgi:DNA-binding SARP family transcriptional activator
VTATPHPSRRKPARTASANHRPWRLVAGTVRLASTALRGLFAATVLLALVVGLPWAMVHYIGWPLPDHIPTWAEVQSVLLGPMTATFLLDFLACLCWIIWALFVLDVARCTFDVARDVRLPDLSAAGPVHTLAAVLVGAVLLSILNSRTTSAPAPLLALAGSEVVATAPVWQRTPQDPEGTVRNAVFVADITTGSSAGGGSSASGSPSHPESVVVRAPENGVYDSLSRIAQRVLGDSARWPEIFHLNQGKPQPYGHVFTNPHLIYPGQQLALPAADTTPAPPPPAPTTGTPTTPAPSSSPQPSSTVAPAPSTRHAPSSATGTNTPPVATREPGFSWGPELFVGLGLAGAVSAALLIARRRFRARYRPGSGDREDFPIAPVVYQLRLAHLRDEHDDEHEPDEIDTARRIQPPPPVVVGAPEGTPDSAAAIAPGLGVRDGREIALDLATARGLGLLGDGAPAAARALLVAALTANCLTTSSGATVLVPDNDLTAVLGRAAERALLPANLWITAGLDDALDALEREILVRATTTSGQDNSPSPYPPLVLVTRVPDQQRPRLQAVLDNGAPFGITGLLLGQWQPGVTAYTRQDGTISATSPGLGEALRGARMFRLGDDNTADILTLLHQANPDIPADEELFAPKPGPEVRQPDPTGKVAPKFDNELELTATAAPPATTDTALEIIDPHAGPTSGARLRPRVEPAGSPAKPDAAPVPEHDPAAEDEDTTLAAVTELGPTSTTARSIRISVLGAPQVFFTANPAVGSTDTGAGAEPIEREVTSAFQPRTRELLMFLALHPGGASREALVAALWGDSPPEKTTNAMNTALSRLRRSLTKATGGAMSDIVIAGDGRYRLDPSLVTVDYWHFDEAVAARRSAATDAQRVDAYRAVVDTYGGALADGMSTEWIETAREAIRRDAIDAVAALARALVADDPQQTLDLLEVARAFDPHNEGLYRDIMRLQERLGQLDAIPRTLTLLTTRLAEVDDHPTEQAISLAARLRQRHDEPIDPQARPVAAHGRRRRAAR